MLETCGDVKSKMDAAWGAEVARSARPFQLHGAESVSTIVITAQEAPVLKVKVRKIGNSLGVVLPKEVISRLNTGDGAVLFLIEGPNGGYQLTPYDPGFAKKMEKAEDIIRRYRNTLHVLSK